MTEKDSRYERAKRIASSKVSFIRHFITYIVVLAVLALINNLTSRGYQWWLWIALFWGIGIIFDFLKTYVFMGGRMKSLEDRMVKREMERMSHEE
ncbi:MAG TPA: 2TM domain-containing protein [Spirochaetota bacterium]|nr:2TM domain-containing protein [Spirochaetota bacterium]